MAANHPKNVNYFDRTVPVEKLTAAEIFHIIKRALGVSYHARSKASTVVSALGFALALLPTCISLSLRKFTDAVQGVYQGTVDLSTAFVLLAVMVTFYIAKQLYDAVRNYYANIDTELIVRYIKEVILRTTCQVKMKYIDNHDDFVEKVSFADSFAGEQVARSMQEVALWLQNVVSLVALCVILVPINPWLVLVIIITCLPSLILAYKQEQEVYTLNKEWSREQAFIGLYYQDCTRFQCLQETRFQRIFPYIRDKKWRTAVDAFVTANNQMLRRHTVANCLADLFRGSVYLIILVMVAKNVYDNPALGLGAFTMVVATANQMQSITTQLFFGASQFVTHVHYMKDFFELENLEREEIEEAEEGCAPCSNKSSLQKNYDELYCNFSETAETARGTHPSSLKETREPATITFRNVSFAYSDTDTLALRNINVTIHEGEKVAIVGRNGSGKSTFVNLLCGLYEPTQGSVRIGAREVSANLTQARQQISAIFQNFGRYEDTIRFNVAVSDLGRETTDEEIMDLCEQAGAAEFIAARKAGLDEVVGSYSEGGNNLSGGQWQRLAIARAAFRKQARIMLLDEPTSALDPRAEASIYRNFANLVGDRTALLISHRLGIASIVDRVLVFDNGQIVEDGTHEELLAAGGLYAELFEAQAQWYK